MALQGRHALGDEQQPAAAILAGQFNCEVLLLLV